LTRLTNGLGEKHNQFSKSIGTQMAPCVYTNQAMVVANGSACTYSETITSQNTKKRKMPQVIELKENEDFYEGEETYFKPKCGLPKQSTYQSSVQYTEYKSPQSKSQKKIKNQLLKTHNVS
jgi:hypothetical protein